MTLENFVPDSEAAALAGVSVRTLQRFAEAGYLQIETNSSGQQLFARSEIKEVFGVKEQPEIDLEGPVYRAEVLAPAGAADAVSQTAERIIELTLASAQRMSSAGSPPAEQISGAPLSGSGTALQSHYVPRAVALLEQELSRLRNLNDLQEKLLDARERELHDLREQRDWLRSRLESLEEKSKRDQVLLLAEAQTVRQLIAVNERRRSPLRATLEWFGLIQPAAAAGLLDAPKVEDLDKA